MSTSKKITVELLLLGGLMFAGACGGSALAEVIPTNAETIVDQAFGEELVSNDCPDYGWKYLQIGTSEDDEATAIATDGACKAYIAGNTLGTLTSEEESNLYQDGFISRLPNIGSTGWTHQFGTEGNDIVRGLAVSALGTSYVVGETQGMGITLLAAGSDGLAASFDSSGAARWQSTYGVAADDFNLAVALKKDDSPFVAGANFADLSRSSELWLNELASADGRTTKESLLGTPEYDRPEGVAIDQDSGDIFLCGSTAGDMGTWNRGSSDAFVRKLHPDYTSEWIYQIGTDDVDVAQRVVWDPATKSLYVLALSYSDLATGASENDGRVAPFVIKLDKDGHQKWIVRIGSPGVHLQARGLALGPTGELYIAGSTPGRIGTAASSGGWDGYVVKLNSIDGKVKWSKQFGSAGDEAVTGLTVSPNGRILVSGSTSGALEGSNLGKRDAFVANISPKGTEF